MDQTIAAPATLWVLLHGMVPWYMAVKVHLFISSQIIFCFCFFFVANFTENLNVIV